jgi:MIP family channel proteins
MTVFGKLLSEAIGTFAIVLIGVGSVCSNAESGVGFGLVGIALTFGLVVAMMVATLGHISGAHINPAFTVVAMALRHTRPSIGMAYILAQVVGATAGAMLLRVFFSPEILEKVAGGTTRLGPGVSPMLGFTIEVVLTFFLILVVFGAAIDEKGSKVGAVAIGGIVAALVLMGAPLTGTSMNPARSIGPAIVFNQWQDHWVYWAGPTVGALLAGFAYEYLLKRKTNT